MPTTTYTPIASVTLSASASEVVFSGLPQTYRDIIIVFDSPAAGSDSQVLIEFNGDTTGNFVKMVGTGSSTASSSSTSLNEFGLIRTGGRATIIGAVFDYSATDKHKTTLSRTSNAGVEVVAAAGRWANTAAVTSFKLRPNATNFPSGTTVNLFGVIA